MLAIRDRLLDSQPQTMFIACHFSNQGNDLATLSKVLDKFRNLNVDLSARDYEIGREPRTAAKFLEKYQDRVMSERIRVARRRCIRRGGGCWRRRTNIFQVRTGGGCMGWSCRHPVLAKIYRDNAKKYLNWTPVAVQ